jgi:hypothetical protein
MNMATEHRCHFLELPAELRIRIYEYALAPTGSLALTSTRTKRHATVPILAPALLTTCRQIHSEAANLLYAENSICITVDAHDTCWPTIAEARLPQRVLEKLQHMTVLLDATSYFNASYSDVDWTAFSALVSLRTLRIGLITVGGLPAGTNFVTRRLRHLPDLIAELLPEILERIPASTELVYGTNADSEQRKISDHAIQVRERGRLDKLTVMEVGAYELAEIALEVTKHVERGCKSGVVVDVFWEHRDGLSSKCGVIRT